MTYKEIKGSYHLLHVLCLIDLKCSILCTCHIVMESYWVNLYLHNQDPCMESMQARRQWGVGGCICIPLSD